MSLKSKGLEPIPEETRQLMARRCPKGTMITQLRDALGSIYSDEAFAHLFAKGGRPAEAPWRLALVTVFQVLEGVTDRQAAESVQTRVDWAYALYGLTKTHLFHLCIAAALNLRRIAFHLQAEERGQPSRPVRSLSPFARLQSPAVA